MKALSPDCRAGKCTACTGAADDDLTGCRCPCHRPPRTLVGYLVDVEMPAPTLAVMMAGKAQLARRNLPTRWVTLGLCPGCEAWQLDYDQDDPANDGATIERIIREHAARECPALADDYWQRFAANLQASLNARWRGSDITRDIAPR